MSREIFRQGNLFVVDNASGGWSVCYGDACRADVDGAVVTVVVDKDAHVKDAVVGVVARALVERAAGWFHVHAGFLADGTLIVGESGAGKTTTTLALSAAATLLTDDVVFVQRRGDDVVARPLPRPLHVGDVTLGMFPQLRPRVLPGKTLAGKAIVAASAVDVAAVVVTRLVFPIIAGTPRTSATALTSTNALPLLLRGSAMVVWPGLPRANEHLDALGALARLPAVAVILGRDAIDDPGVIRRVVDDV